MEIGDEGILRADRLADAIRAHRPLVDAAGDPVEEWAGLAEMAFEKLERAVAQVAPVFDAEPLHLGGGRRADAMELRDRQRLDERGPHTGCDDEQPVRLVLIGGKLGEEFVVGNAGGGRQPGLGADVGADHLGDIGRERDVAVVLGDVEIGLVEAQRFDQRGVAGEDIADLARDRAVGVEARLDEDKFGAAAARGHGRHGRAHAEFPRLVAGGGDDAAFAGAADGDRLAAQVRIVALLDGRIERIHVDMDDLARRTGFDRFRRPHGAPDVESRWRLRAKLARGAIRA